MFPKSQKVVTGGNSKLLSVLSPGRRAPRWLSKGSSVFQQTKGALALVLGYLFRALFSQLSLSQLRCQLPSVAHLYFPVKMDQMLTPNSRGWKGGAGWRRGKSFLMTHMSSLPSASFSFPLPHLDQQSLPHRNLAARFLHTEYCSAFQDLPPADAPSPFQLWYL